MAFRWLRQHQPSGTERTLVHGDYRIGNVIFGPEGARAILDWELAHIGDPMEDLGWMAEPGQAFREKLLAHLRRTVRDKLIVSSPGWVGE